MKVYTRKGDDGTTGLLFGGRVRKDSPRPTAYGSVDETQAALGVARTGCVAGGELDVLLHELERELLVLMAELATDSANRDRLIADETLVSATMVERLEARIDSFDGRFEPPSEFVMPGDDPVSAALDLARTVARRAERDTLVALSEDDESLALAYLNRLSDLIWTVARWQEQQANTQGAAR